MHQQKHCFQTRKLQHCTGLSASVSVCLQLSLIPQTNNTSTTTDHAPARQQRRLLRNHRLLAESKTVVKSSTFAESIVMF